MSARKTPFDEAVALASEHGWVIDKSVTKAVVVDGHFSKLRNVEVTLRRPPSYPDHVSGAGATVLVGQGESIPAAVRAALGILEEG